MAEETDTPFECDQGIVVLEGMCDSLGCLDQFAVGDAGSRPCLRKMVGIELEQLSSATRNTSCNDVFAVATAFFDGVHGPPERIDAYGRHQVAHSPGVGSGYACMRSAARGDALQTANDACFQVLSHDV